MRLRRESGDFSIKIVSGAATIRTGLSPEDLLAYVVEVDGVYTVITSTTYNSDKTAVTLTAGSASYTYTVATGAVAVAGE